MYHSFFDFRDLSLNINEFTALLRALFRNEKGRPYPIDETMCTEIFNIFNKSGVRAHVETHNYNGLPQGKPPMTQTQ